ncbi:uncharacterized protein LOC100827320 [Brachypodium distachyon]|uniref:Uncharacterized protein n=1 Tax=Brachypodium distachyon TaxID=15368 RepID=A0A0Q3J832_BRADI|nr:uncharacterized protein LOC100827320 [Brachypodium distachyon]KQK13995.1 hypothetical protein BRADI_1g13833v3 [Brachypodium distachyon]|eukprot:XP_014752592.1 uncharacterized protein LOC100827320 [Brachypodium distachyon]
MDIDAHEAPSSPPPPPRAVRSRPTSWGSSASSGSGGGGGGVEYTSLRDVLVSPGGGGGGSRSGSSFGTSDVHDFDTSNITIRNQLLKHAASAYLQSAIVVTPRHRGCLSRIWRRVMQRRRMLLRRPAACCPRSGESSCAFAEALAGSARSLLACLSGCFARLWTS